MKKGAKELFFYLFIVLVIVGIVYYVSVTNTVSDNYTYESFVEDLNEGQIEKVVIKQNKEIPTGKITITYTNGDVKSLFVSDVNKVENDLGKSGKAHYLVKDVSRDSIFLTDILPLLIILATGIFFFFLIKSITY